MSWQATTWAKRTKGLGRSDAKMLLGIMADYADESGLVKNVTHKVMAEHAERDERTVRRAIARLEAAKFLTTTKKGNQHNPSVYQLNLDRVEGEQRTAVSGTPSEHRTIAAPDIKSTGHLEQEHRTVTTPAPDSYVPLRSPTEITGTKNVKTRETTRRPRDERTVTTVTDAYRALMRDRYRDRLGDRVDEKIDLALAHTAATKYTDKQAYVNNWLRNDAERASKARDGGHSGGNGRTQPFGANPQPGGDLGRYQNQAAKPSPVAGRRLLPDMQEPPPPVGQPPGRAIQPVPDGASPADAGRLLRVPG